LGFYSKLEVIKVKSDDKVRCVKKDSEYYNNEYIIIGFFDKNNMTYADLHEINNEFCGLDVEVNALQAYFELITE
jgi:hypothetical protein